MEHAPNHLPKMQNYVALYGFLRTITFLSVVLFWAVIIYSLCDAFSLGLSVRLILGGFVLSYILFMAFVKFYRRFSLEAMIALAACYQCEA